QTRKGFLTFMKKKGLLTTTFMMVAMLPGTLQAKVSKTKKPIKKKTLAANTKSKNISRKKITSSNSGIYSIPKNNKSELVVEKMNELKKYHEKVLHSGTAAQKKKVFTQKKLLTSYSHWKGTKYALGGDSKKGIDCSALTRQVYREVYKKELPRVSAQQVKSGKRVANKNSFCRMHMPLLFCIKTNLRENRFFAARLANGDEKGSHNVKIFTKN
ncbi:MAG: NlpC/P60 family protein, partial [Prevotella sp.]